MCPDPGHIRRVFFARLGLLTAECLEIAQPLSSPWDTSLCRCVQQYAGLVAVLRHAISLEELVGQLDGRRAVVPFHLRPKTFDRFRSAARLAVTAAPELR